MTQTPSVDTISRLLAQQGYALDADAVGRIAEQYARLAAVAAGLDAVPLTAADEPAPTFVPRAPASVPDSEPESEPESGPR